MKTVCKKLLCLMLVAMLLVSAVPAAFAADDTIKCETHNLDATRYTAYDVEATCTAAGKIGYLCAGDGAEHMVYKEVAKKAHNYGDGEITTAATCGTAGVLTKTCTNTGCDATTTESIAATGKHNFGRSTLTKAPTCDERGEMTAECVNEGCTATDITYIDAQGHNLENGFCTKCDYKTETAEAGLVISVYNWDGNNRTWIKDVTKPAGTYKLTEAFASEIYPGQKIKYDWGSKSGSTVDATKSAVNVTLSVTPLQTENNKNVYKLRVMFNRGNGNDDYKQIDIYEGEGILAAIKNAGIAPKYEDHVLVGYLNSHSGTSKSYLTIYDVADGDDANDQGVIKVFADWRDKTDDDDEDYEYGEGGGLYGDDNDDPIYDVVLYIYTNGKTSSYAKKVTSSSMGKHTKDGVLTRDEVELVVENYFKTTEDTKYYGLFNKYYWNSGDYLTENAKYSIELDPDETNYVYVMVKNATAYVADSSNPKTGDTIMIAVSTMALAAAALVSMVELKKRKMI